MRLYDHWRMCRRAKGDGKNAPKGAIALYSDKDYGYIVKIDDAWEIAIDGSSNMREWLENIMWFRVGKYKEAVGFRNVAEDMLIDVLKHVELGDTVNLRGHSRGGAVCQSLALMLINRGYKVGNVVTFGAPKLGGRKFCNRAREVGLNHTRVVMRGDTVTRLPFFRGRHYDKRLIILENDIKSKIQKHISYGQYLRRIHDR